VKTKHKGVSAAFWIKEY